MALSLVSLLVKVVSVTVVVNGKSVVSVSSSTAKVVASS